MHTCWAVLSHFRRVRLFATPWTVACQAPLSVGFSRQEYWSRLPCLPGDLPNPGIETRFLLLQADSLPAELSGEPKIYYAIYNIRFVFYAIIDIDIIDIIDIDI